MEWWLWVSVGVAFLIAEIALPGGFFFIFFGVSGILVGTLAAAGVNIEFGLQLLLFAGLAVVFLLLFRSKLQKLLQSSPGKSDIGAIDGEVGTAVEGILPGAFGQIELRGATWKAKNISAVALAPGQRCKVESMEGLTAKVQPE